MTHITIHCFSFVHERTLTTHAALMRQVGEGLYRPYFERYLDLQGKSDAWLRKERDSYQQKPFQCAAVCLLTKIKIFRMLRRSFCASTHIYESALLFVRIHH